MSQNSIRTIQEKLVDLFDSINQISPIKDLASQDHYNNSPYVENLIKVLDSLITKANQEKELYSKEIQRLESDIVLFSKQLNIEMNEVPIFENLGLHREFLENELNKVFLIRNKVENEIKTLLDCIISLSNELDVEFISSNDYECISLGTIEALKLEKQKLEAKIKDLESHRQSFYDIISELSAKLCRKVNFSFSEKICELKKQVICIQNEYQARKEELEMILDEIRKRENILNLESKQIDFCLDNETFEEAKHYNDFLKSEQNRLFEEIFDRTLAEIKEIDSILGRKNVEYHKNEEVLIEMRKLLDKFHNIKAEYNEIVECLNKRKELLTKMTEFEVLASDPKRLFKSSFQLISEEKFRNSAYPSLLKIEEALFDKIDAYEENYGAFIFEEKLYKSALKNEIDNRIINRTVFISRCDSPYRKKK